MKAYGLLEGLWVIQVQGERELETTGLISLLYRSYGSGRTMEDSMQGNAVVI